MKRDFGEPSFWLGLGLELGVWEFVEPWLHCSIEGVSFFGGAGVEFMFQYWG